jgi:hypothetical protein
LARVDDDEEPTDIQVHMFIGQKIRSTFSGSRLRGQSKWLPASRDASSIEIIMFQLKHWLAFKLTLDCTLLHHDTAPHCISSQWFEKCSMPVMPFAAS